MPVNHEVVEPLPSPTRVLAVRLPVELADEIDRRANELDRSVSWVIKNWLQVTLESLQASEAVHEYGPAPLAKEWAIAAESGVCGHTYELGVTFALPPVGEPDYVAYDITTAVIRVIHDHGAVDPCTRLTSLAGMRMDTRPGQGYAHNNPDDLLLPEA